MAKRFSPEFKQQAIEYALANLHEPLAAIARKLGVGYSTLDKRIVELEKEIRQIREANDIFKKAHVYFLTADHAKKSTR